MKLLVSALEPSSNLHLREVLKHLDDVRLSGIFDRRIEQGTPLYDNSEMAVMGIVDALKKLPWYLRVASEMVELAGDADKVLLMDGSGFNLPLAKKIKSHYPDKPIIYYILPQVWASRPGRIADLERYCDALLGILPFETALYPSGKARYVGHPLLDEITVTRDETTIQSDTVAFLPGSRLGEIHRLMPVFHHVRRHLADKRTLLVVPPHFNDEKIAELYGDIRSYEIVRSTHEALRISEFAFICSGTATLEAALIGTPFVLAYIAKPFDYFIGSKLLKIQEVGLANILLRRSGHAPLHEELLQDAVTAENLLRAYETTDRTSFAQSVQTLRNYLAHGSSRNVAKVLQT